MLASLRFSGVSFARSSSNLYESTVAKPRFFLPHGTLYCNSLEYHRVISGMSVCRPASVRSRTISGKMAINSRLSSLLATVVIAAWGTALEVTVDKDLQQREDIFVTNSLIEWKFIHFYFLRNQGRM